MKLKIIVAVLAIAAPTAFAQENATPTKPTYILVDASGSMKGDNLKEAEAFLKREVSSLVSITYFGGKADKAGPPRACGESMVASPEAPPGAILPPIPELGGNGEKTAIGDALKSALSVDDQAIIVLITDGDEECLADFKAIRAEYPEAKIKVLQVGSTPNTALELLELKPQAEPAETPDEKQATAEIAPPLIPPAGTPTVTPPASVTDAWMISNWGEKYLWLIAYALVAASAYFRGSRFGKMAITYERDIEALEQYRRDRAEATKLAQPESEVSLPKPLSPQDVAKAGLNDHVRFAMALVLALVPGVPLMILDGANQFQAGVVGGAYVLAIFASAFLLGGKRASRQSGKGKKQKDETTAAVSERVEMRWLPEGYKARAFFVLVLSVALAVMLLSTDLDKARDASWLVLSSNFSGAIAVAAAGPLLFMGGCWWRYDKAKFTHYIVTNEALSAEERANRASILAVASEWNDLRGRIAVRSFVGPLDWLQHLTRYRTAAARKNRDLVIEKARAIATALGGEAPSASANQIYREFVSTSGLEDFVRQLAQKLSDEQDKALWNTLADSLKGGQSKRIDDAFATLAKSLA